MIQSVVCAGLHPLWGSGVDRGREGGREGGREEGREGGREGGEREGGEGENRESYDMLIVLVPLLRECGVGDYW